MIILNIKIDNLYMFKNFELDFTFPKKISNLILEDESLEYAPKIKVKKVNILMGANASGKTSFGKILCDFQNYILGRDWEVFDKIYDKTEKAKLEVIYVINKYLFKLSLEISNDILHESLSYIKLYKSYTYEKAKITLEKAEVLNKSVDLRFMGNDKKYIRSLVFDEEVRGSLVQDYKGIVDKLTFKYYNNLSLFYYFKFSEFSNYHSIDSASDDFLLRLEKILKLIDDSVDSIERIKSSSISGNEEKLEKDFYIKFKNQDKIIVKEGKARNIEHDRLSQGTVEAIDIAWLLSNIKYYEGLIYLDEQMAYMHTELANLIVKKLVAVIQSPMQLFITSHDENILRLNLPIHSYTFFKRTEDGIEVVHPEKSFKKNDRSLEDRVKNDYFNIYPDLDSFWEE